MYIQLYLENPTSINSASIVPDNSVVYSHAAWIGHSNLLQSDGLSALFAFLVAPLSVPRQEACLRDSYL